MGDREKDPAPGPVTGKGSRSTGGGAPVAGLNDDAQWIILMGFIVSFSFFFLALVINQSTVVGQTTAESVIEFPKTDIRDVREVIIGSASIPDTADRDIVTQDIRILSLHRKNAVVNYTITPPNLPTVPKTIIKMHYNNGVTLYNENWTAP
jgi:hypothetical protein